MFIITVDYLQKFACIDVTYHKCKDNNECEMLLISPHTFLMR